MKIGLGIGIQKRNTVPGVGGKFLDIYTDAVSAYSLRELSTAWAGQDVILARRSSDDAELGFTASEIEDGTLEAWAGIGDVYVKTWYDQKGSNDLTQATTTWQPRIAVSGSLLLVNGKPAIYPFNNQSRLTCSLAGSPNTYFFSVSNLDNASIASSLYALFQGDTSGKYILLADEGSATTTINSGVSSEEIRKNGDVVTPVDRDEVFTIFVNQQSLITFSCDNSTWTDLSVGYPASNSIAMYAMQEVIIFQTDQSSSRSAIEAAINSYYLIY